MNMPAAAKIDQDLATAGFLLIGSFQPRENDNLPKPATGKETLSVLLIGSTGPALWPHFSGSPEFCDGLADPLDRFTRRILGRLAEENGFTALFPFDGPPYHPFQQWALRCGGFSRSPLGVLAHETFGLWLGLRAAFLSAEPYWTERRAEDGPCQTCELKPCLWACPVNAVSQARGYDVPACRAHLSSAEGKGCFDGCLARRSCPVGAEFSQSAEQGRFHMDAFRSPSFPKVR